MAITITANDANKDGKGIDFSAYLANYNKTFTRAGYGGFNSTDPMAMSGTQYYSNDASKYGVVLTSGKTAWNYNMSTHKVTGSLNTVEFGNSIALDSATSTFKMVSDVKITGLGVTDTTLGGQILSDIMGGKSTTAGATTSLVKILSANSIVFNGSTGSDVFAGYAKADTISGGNGNDLLRGGGGDDTLKGGNNDDRLYGDAGNDKLYGDAGADKLYGGAGNDLLSGGAGIDRLYGNAGADKLYGGDGADLFIFQSVSDSTMTARDMVYDFSHSQGDRVHLSAIDANTKVDGDQSFTFVGEKAFSNKAGELRYTNTNGDTYLYGDVNGDGKTDFSVRFDKTIDFVKGDFIL